MLNSYLILFLLILLSNQIFSQNISNSDPSQTSFNKIDSLQIFNPFKENRPSKPYLLYDENLKRWNVIVPEYRLRSSKYFSTNNYLFSELSDKSNWIYPEDDLESFKLSLNILREIEYKNRMKYDLGEIGKYLGLSKNIMAIILAILSVLKH
jgi:hypothetical protein